MTQTTTIPHQPLTLHVSKGNMKTGELMSTSFMPGTDWFCKCKKCEDEGCYAKRYTAFRPSVKRAYIENSRLYLTDKVSYWRQFRAAVEMDEARFGDSDVPRGQRINVGGEIPDDSYFAELMKIVKEYPHRLFVGYTKAYDIVNNWMWKNGELPKNMYQWFSKWKGFKMDNPNDLPVTHILEKDGSCTIEHPERYFKCPGKGCDTCMYQHIGCFDKNNKVVIFNKH